MQELLQKLQNFFQKHSLVIIVNTSTDQALLCFHPECETQTDAIFMKFESLNERGGNSVLLKSLVGETKNTLYLENEYENVLMLQALNLINYRHYIKPQYANAPEAASLEELNSLLQKEYARHS